MAVARNVTQVSLAEEMAESYMEYAMSTLIGRAIPDVRDGLKPVQRRILVAMNDLNLTPNRKHLKCAKIAGQTSGDYHPHGEQNVYPTLVRMAQDFSLRYPLIDGQGNFGCFTGDTRLKLLDGTERSFEELAEQYDPDEVFYVYAINPQGEIVVGEGRNARVTRRNAELMELTLDNGAKIRCTPDHRFMLRDGTYKEARLLTEHDSLMPGYFKTAPLKEGLNEYLMVQQPSSGESQFVHHLADLYNLEKGLAPPFQGPFVQHHKNFNRWDNSPDNLERMLFLEHLHLHAEQIQELWPDEAFREKQRAGVRRYYAEKPQALEACRHRVIRRNQSPESRPVNGERVARSVREHYQEQPEKRAEIARRMRELWNDPDYRIRMSEAWQGIEKRPLSPEQKARVAEIISEKSRAMWADESKRAAIVAAIQWAMDSEEVWAKVSAAVKAKWEDLEYRAQFPSSHFSAMARQLGENPEAQAFHREKVHQQRQDETFVRRQREGVQRSNHRRMAENPDMRHELAPKAAASLAEKWQEEAYRARVVRSRILNYGAYLLAPMPAGEITPEVYEANRYHAGIPHLEKAMTYFSIFGEFLAEATTYNRRVVARRMLDERADVYDITVDPHHNFLLAAGVFVHNSVDGDPPAAMRYTEARLTPLAMELLADLDKDTVDFRPNYDERLEEPVVLPGKFPNLLVNGTEGIAVGMSTKIPPHNLYEVVAGVCALIDNPNLTNEELMEYIPGPDFPTHGLVLGQQGIREMYATGRGSITLQARAVIEPIEGHRNAIIVTELPYQVNKARLQEIIAELVNTRKIDGISAIRDETDRNGIRLVIELRRDAVPHVVLNQLYKRTPMRANFPAILLALVDGVPRLLDLKGMLHHFIEHRREVWTRRTKFELKAAEARAHILEGLLLALRDLDEVIRLIRAATNRTEAREALRQRLGLSEKQAQAIVDMTLGMLTGLERQRIEEEHRQVQSNIEYLRGLLADPQKILALIKKEQQDLARQYGDPRRTTLRSEEAEEIRIQDLIAEEDMTITITRDGYAKRLPVDTYRVQRRGGKGRLALTKKEEDEVEHLFVATTHHYILFFTNRGRVYRLRAYEVPQASRQARGTPIINLIQIEPGEQVTAAIPVADFEGSQGYLFMATRRGTVKKTALADFRHIHRGGIIAMNIPDDDDLKWVRWTKGEQEVILATRNGMSIRFSEEDVRPMGRNATGVRGIRLHRGDEVVGVQIVDETKDVLAIGELGYGKRTPFDEYRQQTRGGIGIITYKVTGKTGPVVGLEAVDDEDEVMILTAKGVLIRIPVKHVRQTGRSAQGVKLIDLQEDDAIKTVTKVVRGVSEEPEEQQLRLTLL